MMGVIDVLMGHWLDAYTDWFALLFGDDVRLYW